MADLLGVGRLLGEGGADGARINGESEAAGDGDAGGAGSDEFANALCERPTEAASATRHAAFPMSAGSGPTPTDKMRLEGFPLPHAPSMLLGSASRCTKRLLGSASVRDAVAAASTSCALAPKSAPAVAGLPPVADAPSAKTAKFESAPSVVFSTPLSRRGFGRLLSSLASSATCADVRLRTTGPPLLEPRLAATDALTAAAATRFPRPAKVAG